MIIDLAPFGDTPTKERMIKVLRQKSAEIRAHPDIIWWKLILQKLRHWFLITRRIPRSEG